MPRTSGVAERERCRLVEKDHAPTVHEDGLLYCTRHERPAPADAEDCFEIRPWLCPECGRNQGKDDGMHDPDGTCHHHNL